MRILVVDDEVRLANSLARGLRAEGFDVDVVHDGDDALWRATEADYAAIVLDIMLPGRNGYQVCSELRERGVETPVMMLTAKSGEYDEAEGLDTGADDYLRKPFSFVVLVARLNALLRRRAGGATADQRIEVGDLTLDRSSMRAVRRPATDANGDQADDGGVEPSADLELTPREFALLELLARRAPDVVSKRSLLDTVWGLDFDGDPNIVEVYVGYVRKKLGRDLVQTVRGVGYRLRSDR
ncbi:MAG: response regulator transcription factor [Actinomycetota bacterium]